MAIRQRYEVDGSTYEVEFDKEPSPQEIEDVLVELGAIGKAPSKPTPDTTAPLPANVAGPQLTPPVPVATTEPQAAPKAVAPLSSYTPAESKQFIPTAAPAPQQAPQPAPEPVKQPVQGPENKWTPETISAAARAKFSKKIEPAPKMTEASVVPTPEIKKEPSQPISRYQAKGVAEREAALARVEARNNEELVPTEDGAGIVSAVIESGKNAAKNLMRAGAVFGGDLVRAGAISGQQEIGGAALPQESKAATEEVATKLDKDMIANLKIVDEIESLKPSVQSEDQAIKDSEIIKGGISKDPIAYVGAALRTGAGSTADMLLSVLAGPAGVVSMAGTMSGQMAESLTSAGITDTDIIKDVSGAYAIPAAFAEVATNNILAKGIKVVPGTAALGKRISSAISGKILPRLIGQLGLDIGEASTEGLEELIQQKGLEESLTAFAFKKWKDKARSPEEMDAIQEKWDAYQTNLEKNGMSAKDIFLLGSIAGLAIKGVSRIPATGKETVQRIASGKTGAELLPGEYGNIASDIKTSTATKEPVKEAPPAATVSDKLPEAEYKRTIPTKEEIDTKSAPATETATTTTETASTTTENAPAATPIVTTETTKTEAPTIDKGLLRGDRTQSLAELKLTPEQVVAMPQGDRAAVLSSISTKEAADIRRKVSASVVGQGLTSMGYTPEQFVKEWQETKVAPASLDKLPPEDVKSVLALVSAARQVTKEAEKKERDTQREIVAKEVAARKNIIAREVMRTTKGFGKLSKDELDIHKTRIANTVMEQDIKDALLNNIDKKIKKLARENRVNVGDKSKPIPAYTEHSSETVAPIAQEQTTAPIAEPIIRGSKTTDTTPGETLSQPEVETVRDKFVATQPRTNVATGIEQEAEGNVEEQEREKAGKVLSDIISGSSVNDKTKEAIRDYFNVDKNGFVYAAKGVDEAVNNNNPLAYKDFLKKIGRSALAEKYGSGTVRYDNAVEAFDKEVSGFINSALNGYEKYLSKDSSPTTITEGNKEFLGLINIVENIKEEYNRKTKQSDTQPTTRGSKTTETTLGETLSQPEVETVRDKFVAALPANIRETLSTAWAEDTPDVLAKMNENGFSAAAQRNDNGTTTVYFKKNASKNDIIPNAIEEVVGHHGVWELFKEDNEFKNLINFLHKSDSKYSETNAHVESNYKEQIDKATTEEEKNSIRLDEWIAKKIVDYRTNKDARGIGKKVVDAIAKVVKKLLVRVGVRKQDKVTVDSIVEAIHSRLQEGRSDAITPTRTQQWKQELGMPSEATVEANNGEILRGAKKTDKQILADIERKARKIVEPKETAAKEKKVIQDEFTAELEKLKNRDAVEATEAAVEAVLHKQPDFSVKMDWRDKFKSLVTDRFLWVKKIQDEAERILGRKFTEEESVWMKQKVSSAIVAHKFNALNFNFLRPLTETLEKYGIDAAELGEYRTGLHIKEANARGKSIDPKVWDDEINPFFGMATSEGQAIQDKYAKDQRLEGFKKANDIVSEMLQWKLDNMVKSGLISEQVAEKWKQLYPNYVTAQGYDAAALEDSGLSDEAIDEIEASVAGQDKGTGTKGFSVYQSWKTRKGRTTKADIDNAIAAMINGTQKAIVRAEKNEVVSALKALSETLPKDNDYMQEISEREFANIPENALLDTHKFKTVSVVQQLLYSNAPVREKDAVIKGFKNGEPFYIKLKDPRLYRAMKWNRQDYMSDFSKLVSKGTKWMGSMLTRRNVLFPLTNVPRDIQAAAIRTSALYGPKAGADFLRNWRYLATSKAIKKYEAGQPMTSTREKYIAEFMSLGGRISSGQVETIEQLSKRLNFLNDAQQKAANTGKLGVAKNVARSILGTVERATDRLNENTELATRIAHYIAARENGVPPKKAVISARDVTVDFNQFGELAPSMNALFAFWNASIVSSSVVVNTLRSKKGKFLMAALMAAGYAMARHADDDDKDEYGNSDYAKQPVYNKTNKWYVYKKDDGTFVTTPMPYGFNVFPSLGALLYNVQKGYIKPQTAAYEWAMAARNSFIPISGEGVNMFVPTVARVGSEWLTNEGWNGQQLYNPKKYGQALTPKWKLAKRNTPDLYVGMSRWLEESVGIDMYPEFIPHALRFIGGPYLDLSNKTMRMFDIIEKKQKLTAADIPVLSKYVVSNSNDAFYSREYYNSKDVLDQFHKQKSEFEKEREAMGVSFKPEPQLQTAIDTFNKSKLPLLEREMNMLYRQRAALMMTKQWEDYKNKYGRQMPGYNTVDDKLSKKQAEFSQEFKKHEETFKELL